jgi:hypothetical protein
MCHVKMVERATEMEVAMAVVAVVESEVESSYARRTPEIVTLATTRYLCL